MKKMAPLNYSPTFDGFLERCYYLPQERMLLESLLEEWKKTRDRIYSQLPNSWKENGVTPARYVPDATRRVAFGIEKDITNSYRLLFRARHYKGALKKYKHKIFGAMSQHAIDLGLFDFDAGMGSEKLKGMGLLDTSDMVASRIYT